MVMAFCVALWSYFGAVHAYAIVGIMVLFIALFGSMMASHIKITFDKIAYCFVAGLLVPYMLTALVRIHTLRAGRYFILIAFVLAFLSDTGAYFAGRAFGKHKLAPVISPKKTIEGVVGGAIGAVLGMILYCAVLQFGFHFRVNYGYAIVYGVLGCAASVFGDLSFSVVKRQTGIKDYGNLIPGHGGILDRFDSMVLVAPLTEALLLLLPVAQQVA
jgi:phosphatidate cytidylyltransferase